ncbi:hypothetical protein [Spirosoma arcticum]
MAVELEFKVEKGFDFAQTFANYFGVNAVNNQVCLPETLGTGFIKEVYLENGLKLCLHRYCLKQPLTLRRLATSAQHDRLTIRFSGSKVQVDAGDELDAFAPFRSREYAIQLATSNLFAQITLPSKENVNFIALTIARQALLNMLHVGHESHPLIAILATNQSFVFHEIMTPEMQRTFTQLNGINGTGELAHLLYQVKTQELICLLFTRLLARPSVELLPIDATDAETIHALRTAVLADLSVTPPLAQLSHNFGLSQTKMTRLFRQVFGDSIYTYYQAGHMTEAARLLIRFSFRRRHTGWVSVNSVILSVCSRSTTS